MVWSAHYGLRTMVCALKSDAVVCTLLHASDLPEIAIRQMIGY
ncbi:hypothetical protein ACO0LL_09710 [Undibacterium sp. TC4M20W]